MKKVLIIIPAYNEEKCILKTCNMIDEYNKKSKLKYDYIVINDGSIDNTKNLLESNNINHINLICNLGIGGAVQTGYKYAYEKNYDIAVQFDGDGQHDVNYIKDLIIPIVDGEANMVIGSRFIDKTTSDFKSTGARRVGIKLISAVIKQKTKKRIYDTTSGFRAVDKSIIGLFAKNYPQEYPEPISSVQVLNNNYKISELPVKMKERQGGKSSITSWKSIYYMFNVIISIMILGKRMK